MTSADYVAFWAVVPQRLYGRSYMYPVQKTDIADLLNTLAPTLSSSVAAAFRERTDIVLYCIGLVQSSDRECRRR